MAHAEVSALFTLKWGEESPVTSVHIGSGVTVEMIDERWLEEVKDQCPNVEARERIEWNGPYTHRLFYQVPTPEHTDDENVTTGEDKQLILRAIILSRLVKPTSIGYDSVWVKSFYRSNENVRHYHAQFINNLSVSFPTPVEASNTLTTDDAEVMAELWPSFQFMFDNALKYERVVRGIKIYELAHSIYFGEMAHTIMHAALESMICTGHHHNRAQVIQRLSQLVSFVSANEAADIYELCTSFKHEAKGLLQDPSPAPGQLSERDQKRVNAIPLLRRAIRDLVTHALRERSFADLLADKILLQQTYPVYDGKGNLVS